MMALYVIYPLVQNIKLKYKLGIYILIAWIVVLLLLAKFCEKLRRLVSIVVIIFSVGISVPTLLELSETLKLLPLFAYLFFAGYIFGFYERVIVLSMPGFLYKSVYTFANLLARGLILGKLMMPMLIPQITVIIMGLVLDFCKIKEDKRVFQSFYDYREELIKFRTLMVSGIPSKILILSHDLKQNLFMNERFHCILDQQTHSENDPLDHQIHTLLNKIHVDKQSLNEKTKLIVDNYCQNFQPLPTLQFLQTLTEQSLLSEQNQKIIFNTFLQRESQTERQAFELKVFPLLWDSQDAVAIVFNDITEQYQNLSLKIADANKDKMLALISHELRTPLNGILGVVQLLEKGTNDSQTLQHLNVCKASGHLLLNLVNSILDLQHIRDNKFSLKVTKIDLYELLQEVYDLFGFQFEQKGLKLTLNAALDLPPSFSTDQNRLKQILINLIGNALKFTFEGGVEITVAKDSNPNTGFIKFSVSDTGTGIKEEDQGKLFKMYGRLDQENPQTNTQGVGFGLEISNRLARLLCEGDDGGIKFDSQVGKGTTFYFFIKESMGASPLKNKSKVQKKTSRSETEETDVDGLNCDELLVLKEKFENLSLKLSPYSMQTFTRIQSTVQTPQHKLITSPKTRISHQFLAPIMAINSDFPKSEENSCDSAKRPKFNRNQGGAPTSYKTRSANVNAETNYSEPSEAHSFIKEANHSIHEKPKILIVDDNPFNLLVARRLAENLGYTTSCALNGKIAIEMLQNCKTNSEQHYCAVLMDLQMPVMDGYEATKILREMMENEEIEEIPIIALSANDSANDKKKCKEIGMRDHISKPLDEKRLKKVLEEVIKDEDSSSSSGEIKLTIPK